jgi:hypothetical protein
MRRSPGAAPPSKKLVESEEDREGWPDPELGLRDDD